MRLRRVVGDASSAVHAYWFTHKARFTSFSEYHALIVVFPFSMVPPAGPYYPMPQPNFNPPAPTFSTAPPISTVPPVTAFTGLAPPVAGSANTRRMTAAQRHSTRGHGGPLNTSTTRVNAPTLPAATPPAALVPVVAPPETPVATATPSFTKFTVGLYPFAVCCYFLGVVAIV